MVGVNSDLLDELQDITLVNFPDVGFLPGNEILKFLDPVHGFGASVGIDFGVFFHLLEVENIVGQGSVVLLVADGLDKLFLQFLHPSLNAVW